MIIVKKEDKNPVKNRLFVIALFILLFLVTVLWFSGFLHGAVIGIESNVGRGYGKGMEVKELGIPHAMPTGTHDLGVFREVNVVDRRVDHYALENSYGRVEFIDTVDLAKVSESQVKKYVSIRNRYIEVVTERGRGIPEFAHKHARLTFEGIDTKVPFYIIRYKHGIDGASGICPKDICKNVIVSGDRVSFEVTEFSGYGIQSNNPPTQTAPILQSSSGAVFAYSNDNITCLNQSTVDLDGDDVVNIFSFIVDGIPLNVLQLSFDLNRTNETDVVTDYSTYENNASLGGGNIANVPLWMGIGSSIRGGAYQFDGVDDYLNVSHDVEFTNIFAGGLSLWFMPSSQIDSSTANNQVILDKNSGAVEDGNVELYFKLGDGGLAFGLEKTGVGVQELISNTKIFVPGVWYHVALSWNGTAVEMWINGVKQSQSILQLSDPFESTGNLYIGAGSQGTSNFFAGKIDEVLVYSGITLTENQIVQQYANGTGNYDTIVYDMLTLQQIWWCGVTPADGWQESAVQYSNTLMVTNAPPTMTGVNFGSTSGNNYDSDTLICTSVNPTDADGDLIEEITNFQQQGVSIPVINLPFGGNLLGSLITTDYSSYSHNATVNGAMYNASAGVIGGAYEFDGVDDYLQILHDSSLAFPGSGIVIELWASLDLFPVNGEMPLFVKASDATNMIALTIGNNTNGSTLFVTVTNGTGAGQASVDLSGLVNASTYHHYAVSINNAQVDIYLDGILLGSYIYPFTPLLTVNAPIEIGRNSIGGTFFDGKMDQVVVYDRVLSSTYLQTHAQLGYNTITSELTSSGETWTCMLTLNDGLQDGSSMSSSITINQDPGSTSGGTGGSGVNKTIFYVNFTETPSWTGTFSAGNEAWLYGSWKYPYVLTFVKAYYPDMVTLFWTPKIGTLQLLLGDIVDIDVDNDGLFDFTLSVDIVTIGFGIASSSADITLSLYQHAVVSSDDQTVAEFPIEYEEPVYEAPLPDTGQVQEFVQQPSERRSSGSSKMFFVTIAILSILGVTYVIIIKKLQY